MNKFCKTALTPTALVLTAPAVLGTAHAQTSRIPTLTAGDDANVIFQAVTGRPGAVDVYVDGAPADTQVTAGEQTGVLRLSPGTHDITVKASYGGQVLASTTVNVVADNWYAVSLQNVYADRNEYGSGDYTLDFVSGSAAVRNAVNNN